MKLITLLFLFTFTPLCFVSISSTNKKEDKLLSVDTTKISKLEKIDSASSEDNTSGSKDIYLIGSEESFYSKYIEPWVSILTFILGLFVPKIWDKITENKRLEKVSLRWESEIRALEKPIENQINALTLFLNDHRKPDDFSIPNLEISVILSCENLKSLDKADLLKYLEKTKNTRKNKTTYYRKAVHSSNLIHGFTSIMTDLNKTLRMKFEEYLEKSSASITNFSINLQLLTRSSADYAVEIERATRKDPIHDPYFSRISSLFSQHIFPKIETGDYNMFSLQKDFLVPLLEVLSENRLDPRIADLTMHLSNCLIDVKTLRFERHYIETNIQTIIDRYSDQQKEIELLIKELKRAINVEITTHT